MPLELELGDLAVVDAVARQLSAEPRLDALLLGAFWTLSLPRALRIHWCCS